MYKFIGIALVAAASLMADGVTYSSVCQSYGYPAVYGGSSCVSGPTTTFFGRNDNQTTTSTSLNLSAGQTTTLVIAQSATATIDYKDASPFSLYGISTSSQASFAYSQTLTTQGPTRGGYIHVNIDNAGPGGASEGSSGQVNFKMTGDVPGYLPPSIGLSFTCPASFDFSSCGPGPGYYDRLYYYIPFTLGVPFTINATGGVSANGDSRQGDASVSYQVPFSFQLFESDLTSSAPVTVEIVNTPEPATFMLLGFAFAVLWIIRYGNSPRIVSRHS